VTERSSLPNQNDASSDAAAERGIRDIMGLLALPALWAGRDGDTVLRIMSEAIERLVPIRFSLARVALHAQQDPVVRLRINETAIEGEEVSGWLKLTETWHTSQTMDARAYAVTTPLGEMRAIRFSIGYGRQGGTMWFGSPSPDFPSLAQVSFLRAATSLAASGLQTARVSQEREEASMAKDAFLAMLGHELRNPLAPIVTALELIRMKNPDGLAPEHVIIERQVGHLRRLVDDLLDVSRIAKGKVTLQREPIDLNHALTWAVKETDGLFQDRHHELSVELPTEPVWISGDVTRLIQVFTNLLANAAKYTGPGGHVAVTVRISEDRASVSILDNGCGISPQLFPRLFEIFEQGSATIDRSGGGLGIGLALVKTFVELHDGSVTAHSAGVGLGSEFIVTLPLLKHAVDSLPAPIPEKVAVKERGRILLIDDNLDALQTLAKYLEVSGYEVAATHDPMQVLELADQFRPTAAVLDIGLPVMNGYVLASALRKHFPARELRLIALTGYGQATDVQRARVAGFDHHLVKPVKLDDLITALETGK
jgi:signal transduction histidine kinase/CheY-like chemotaxis protein